MAGKRVGVGHAPDPLTAVDGQLNVSQDPRGPCQHAPEPESLPPAPAYTVPEPMSTESILELEEEVVQNDSVLSPIQHQMIRRPPRYSRMK